MRLRGGRNEIEESVEDGRCEVVRHSRGVKDVREEEVKEVNQTGGGGIGTKG